MAESKNVPPDSQDENAVKEDKKESVDELKMWEQALQAKSKAHDYYDQLLRLRAEFENFRKRVEKEKAEARAWGKQEVLLQLVSLVDVFEQAIAQIQKAKDMTHVVQGVELLHKSFAQFLKAEGLEPIVAVGKQLDPLSAEAIEQEEVDDESKVGQVVGEIQTGYRFQGRILRPSRVRVGVAKKKDKEPDPESEEQHKKA